ncbi:hypothetical protein SVAN01_03424 [Stagonosporopsis vannaccii]|nr:hypothetical protein SVAN01_03424 [Stagonosporopsis vannaccii]
MFEAAATRLWSVATPTAPHTRTANCSPEWAVGRVTSWNRCCTPVRSLAWDGDSGSPAGRRRLDATEHPPISTDTRHDLLPAASVGATWRFSHSENLYRVRW